MRHKYARLGFFSICSLGAAMLISDASYAGMFSKKKTQGTEEPLSLAAQEAIDNTQQLIAAGKLNEALAVTDRAIAFDPKSGVPYMAKAYVYDRLGDTKKAGQLYKKAMTLSPNNGYILNAVGVRACTDGHADQADVYFVKALTDPYYGTPYQAMENAGNCALKNQKLDIAETRYRTALETNIGSAQALEGLASISFEKQNFLEARAFLQRRELLGPLNAKQLELAVKIEKLAGDDRNAAIYQKRFDELQLVAPLPVGEGPSSQ
jgi:type IV pilus assembly protein PilF